MNLGGFVISFLRGCLYLRLRKNFTVIMPHNVCRIIPQIKICTVYEILKVPINKLQEELSLSLVHINKIWGFVSNLTKEKVA